MPSTSYLEWCQWLEKVELRGDSNTLGFLTVFEVNAGQALELVLGRHAACGAGEAGVLEV